jgi:hypothetical protein
MRGEETGVGRAVTGIFVMQLAVFSCRFQGRSFVRQGLAD